MLHPPPYSRLRIQELRNNRFIISFYFEGKRYRYADGSPFGGDLKPNKAPVTARKHLAELLLLELLQALKNGWTPLKSVVVPQTIGQHLEAYEINSSYSLKYQGELRITLQRLQRYISAIDLSNAPFDQLNERSCHDYLNQSTKTASSFNHERQRLGLILEAAYKLLSITNPIHTIPKKKIKQTLHKPISNLSDVFEELEAFNENLFLCCLLTYGCLLRPHREIRELTWGDFSDDLSTISLSGRRNKSGRNRLVPISPYIREYLHPGVRTHNIFSASATPYNADYFKSLWTRFKKQSKLLEANQTLYSFRHTGAIEVYKKSKDVAVVQQVMGHASMQVTLGYLRNLEVPVLRVEDMPRLCPNFES